MRVSVVFHLGLCLCAAALQLSIQNAQLAGNIRVAGLYNLGRLSVDAYSILTDVVLVSPPWDPSGNPTYFLVSTESTTFSAAIDPCLV
jgi:hypothetical protein